MPKRRSEPTPKPATKRKKSTMPINSPNPSVAAVIDYDLLASAIIKQSQNSSNTDSAMNTYDNNSAEVSHDINNLDLCENISASDRVNNTIVPTFEDSIQQPSSSNVIPKPATSTSSSDRIQDTADSTTNIANLVNALLQTSGEPATAQIKDVISISDGIPLGAATQQQVKSKIWANQFIDLNILLQQREEPLSLKISTGSVTLQQGFSKPKTPLSIQQWTDAFLIYMAIYIEKYPEQAPHLLKYCFFIREMHKMLGEKSWRVYDENFRMLKESADLPWQKPVEELRVKAAAVCNFQSQQPFRTNAGSRPIKFCYAFNNGESCSHNPCPYSHKCQLCSMSHARVNCRVRRQKQGTINTTKSPHNTHSQPVTIYSQSKKFK